MFQAFDINKAKHPYHVHYQIKELVIIDACNSKSIIRNSKTDQYSEETTHHLSFSHKRKLISMGNARPKYKPLEKYRCINVTTKNQITRQKNEPPS